MDEQNQTKRKKSTKYLLIGTLVLFLSILGASVAYYLARVSGNLSGRAAGTELTINVQKISSNATGDLIPLDNDLETLNLAAAGYDDKGACVDINGYSVCQIYHITLTNNGSVPLTVNGTVTLSGQNVPNIDCARMDNATTVANNNSCMNGMFVNGDELLANDSNDYFVMVYINNLDEPQYDSGEFNGVVTFTTEDGGKVKGRFTKPFNLVQRITKLYNDAQKSTVTNNEIDYQYATSVNLMKDKLGGTSDTLDSGNLRYYGLEPNNYIDIGDTLQEGMVTKGNWELLDKHFENQGQCQAVYTCNNSELVSALGFSSAEECEEGADSVIEQFMGSRGLHTLDDICKSETKYVREPILWRIIGVFDGKLRIVRDESIGSYPYDTSEQSDRNNDGHGINQWGPSKELSNGIEYTGADLMKLLNPGYDDNQDNIFNSNSEDNISNGNSVDYVNNSLWWNKQSGTCYTGSSNYAEECDFTTTGLSNDIKDYVVDQTLYLGGFSNNDMHAYANQAYTVERGNNVRQPDEISTDDIVIRTTKWTGKVGLIYPSDMGYAADFSSCNSTFDYLCPSWLNNNNNRVLRTISPKSNIATFVLNFSKDFIVDNNAAETYDSSSNEYIGVYPTLLLDSSVLAESGNGSKETPYVVAY